MTLSIRLVQDRVIWIVGYLTMLHHMQKLYRADSEPNHTRMILFIF